MAAHRVGIIMNGVTGRMGTAQHLIRSICAIRDQGGVMAMGDRIVPDVILVGRNPDRLKALCAHTGWQKWSTEIDTVLADRSYAVYFDAQTTAMRYDAMRLAIAAGKHVYCEKPVATSSAHGLELHKAATQSDVKGGVVQNGLWLPGMQKLKRLVDSGFFGRVLSVRGEFGYYVFTGHHVVAQRPSWNYRKEDGGGTILDMFCHFSYMLENLFGEIEAVSCIGTTHIPERVTTAGHPYKATAEDAAYATFELEGEVIARINASWCTRVRREDLLTLHVDGTDGSAVAGLQRCWAQHAGVTPRIVWNPDVEVPVDYTAGWTEVPSTQEYGNAFKAQWELFLRHVVLDEPFPWNLLQGTRNVLLAEKAAASWEQRAWVEIPDLGA